MYSSVLTIYAAILLQYTELKLLPMSSLSFLSSLLFVIIVIITANVPSALLHAVWLLCCLSSPPPPSFTSPSAWSLCFRRTRERRFRCPKERRGGCHHDGHLVITSYCLLLSVAVPLLFRPPISPPPPPPLPLLAMLIVALHPLPLLLFLIVVSHLVIVVVILSLSLYHHLVDNVSSFVIGGNGPSCVASTYSHPAAAAPPLFVDCCVASWWTMAWREEVGMEQDRRSKACCYVHFFGFFIVGMPTVGFKKRMSVMATLTLCKYVPLY